MTPDLQAQICDAFAALLRERAGHRVADLERLLTDLRDKLRDAADEQITVAEAAALAGISVQAIRKMILKHNIGRLDPHSHFYLVSKRKLEAVLKRRAAVSDRKLKRPLTRNRT